MTQRRGAAALLLAAGLGLGAAAGAAAEPVSVKVTAVSWWTRQPGASAQPPGGFQVAEGIDGTDSVAAVRVDVPAVQGITASLTLTEAASSIASPSAGIRVCLTTAGWPAANPGPYAQAPKADCGHSVVLKRSGSPARWSGDISSLLSPGATANLEIQPVPSSVAGQVNSTYTVTIAKAAVTAQGPAAPAGAVPVTDAPGALPSPGPGPVATDTVPLPSGGGAVPLPAPAPAAPVATTAPVVTRPETAPAGNPGAIASPNFTPQTFHRARPWGRLLVLVPLAAAFGAIAAGVRRARTARPGLIS